MPATHDDLIKDLQLDRDLGKGEFYKTALEEGDTIIALDKQLENYEEADFKDSLFDKLLKENQDSKSYFKSK